MKSLVCIASGQFDNSFHDKYYFAMDTNEIDKKNTKQPENMVYYKSKKELYSTVHACIMLRELPELTPEELQQISEREQKPK